MKITLAKTAGFCFGVNRAVQMVYDLVEDGQKVCTLGPIIHNSQMVEELASKGVRVVYDKANHTFQEFSLNRIPIDEARIYKIGLQYYFYLNMQDFFSSSREEVAENGNPRRIATSCREVLDEYLSCHQNLDHHISGRLVFE